MDPTKHPLPLSAFTTLIFDFDYTLADSSRGILECVNFALTGLGLPAAKAEAVYATIGKSLKETLVSLAGEEQAGQAPEFVRLFVQRADEVMVNLTILYETVAPAFEYLKTHGKKLGIVSTKFRYRINSTLQRDSLDGLVDVIIGGEDVTCPKPDPEGLRLAIERLGSSPPEVLYIGDSVVDAETAARAGVAFLAVLSGVTPRGDFDGYPKIGVVESLAPLATIPGWYSC